NKPVTKGVTLKPEIAGTWRWSTDAILEFSPDEAVAHAQWEIGQKYEIKLTRDLFPDHVLLEDMDYDFETPQLAGNVTKQEFYQDPRDPQVKKAVVNIRYNYVLDTEDFKKRVSLLMRTRDQSTLGQAGKAIPFTVTFATIPNEAYIVSDNVGIPREDSVVDVKIDEGARTPKGGKAAKIEAPVEVPGLMNFFKFEEPEVTFARNEKFEPEQILVLTSRAGVATETVAKSMKLYLLPKKKKGDEKKKRNSTWTSASEITDDVRGKLESVPFTVVPSAEENSTLHTLRIDIPVGRFVYMKIPAGLKSFGGYELAKDYEAVTGVPEFPKELMIMSQGSVMSLSGDKKIPLLGRNVKKAKFQLFRVLPTQLNQFVYHNYQNRWDDFTKPSINIPRETVAEIFSTKMDVPFKSAAATQYFSLDLEPYLSKDGGSRKGFFYVRVEGEGMADERVVLMTDLGLVSKTNNDTSHDVFVQNLRTGAPVVGAEVDVIGVNGLTVLEQKTNAEGRANFPSLSSFKNEKRPIAFVVRQGGDFSFLPYEMETRALSFSQFDIGGLRESKSGDDLSAYLFSDRGIYRPGDQVNLGLMVRSQDWKKPFAGVPLSWAVTDPRGAEIRREKISVGSTDLSAVTFSTQETSPTGMYTIQVFITKKNKIEEQIGTLAVRVEEFLPDRMRVTATLSKQKAQGWVTPDELKANVAVKNLFGTPAEDRRVVAALALSPTPAILRGFDGYQLAAHKGDEK
ncbi:MAG: MG2 domain-containing protein, partial [Bdellovibrionota bacterium]